ncbi:probable disease resistance protein At1g15890 [Cornus florida]|uniref:probable disease resistance protein At1g15890 n=1 Tax=Cornus florida TaxID=4283 RepID=UPI002897ED7F|nr:probable disease resistance protein At1g15890 [Cornus florida]
MLVSLGVGTKFLESTDRTSIKKARDRTLVIVVILKKSNLLLEGEEENVIKMHDVIRNIAILIVSKDRNAFLVKDDVNVWPDKDDYECCKAISLRDSCKVCRLPDQLECPELRTLVLGSSDDSLLKLPNSFFEGMKKLEVLVLKGMKLVPSSLSRLVGLWMLCLSDCELVNLSFIKELKNVEILVLGHIYEFKEIVFEIGQLTCLRLLNLKEFNKNIGFSSGFLSLLSDLEELCIPKAYDGWEVEGNASIVEINCLTSLTALRIYVPNDVFLLLPTELPSFQLLTKYKIWIGSHYKSFSEVDQHIETKVLGLGSIPLMDGLDVLIANAEVLRLYYMEGLKKVLQDRDGEWFLDLKHLYVSRCKDMEHLLGKPKWSSKTHGPSPLGSFGNLRVLEVFCCSSMKYLFSASTASCLPKLHLLQVIQCEALEEIIGGDEEFTDKVTFHQLEKMRLLSLPNLRSIYANTKKKTSTRECSMPSTVKQPLFNEKTMFPVLEELVINGLGSIKVIWDKQLLQVLKGGNSFQHLQQLQIVDCKEMKEILAFEVGQGEEEAEANDEIPVFPHLKTIGLRDLPNLKSSEEETQESRLQALINHKVRFPSLEKLMIW